MTTQTVDLAKVLIDKLDTDRGPDGRLGLCRRYLAGDHNLPVMPRKYSDEYLALAHNSITNLMPLVVSTFNKSLAVQGFRVAKAADSAPVWEFWQAARLDARQAVTHGGSLAYGVAYVQVLPTDGMPDIYTIPAADSVAVYERTRDLYPLAGLFRTGKTMAGDDLYDLVDDRRVHKVRVPKGKSAPVIDQDLEHHMGVTPWERFRESADDPSEGLVKRLQPFQDALNLSVFGLRVINQYSSFRQRWITGLSLPTDERAYLDENSTVPNPNFGKPIEPYETGAGRVWVAPNTDAKLGDFPQSDATGSLRTIELALKIFALNADIPPTALLGEMTNLSADAISMALDAMVRRLNGYETGFGESWEGVLRLANHAAGDLYEVDEGAQVRWRDAEARSLSQTVDALGKMVTMLKVPASELWSRIPGVTDGDVERWRKQAGLADGASLLADELNRQLADSPEI